VKAVQRKSNEGDQFNAPMEWNSLLSAAVTVMWTDWHVIFLQWVEMDCESGHTDLLNMWDAIKFVPMRARRSST
jgi:hypothetical protein